ncbi:hypothetical protein PS710_00504 [Pseudomonas fluorescens]|uniref:Uncharacterized protein n=1 Tax=Pseudomonas fluorescens TaxID=294 RepID=A0A5E7A251_PSEFL|nr:hypothetical protein PS710_00504 [Pseudomonas fluorescens]
MEITNLSSSCQLSQPPRFLPWWRRSPTGSRRSPGVTAAAFHYKMVIQLLIGCADYLVNLNSLPGRSPAAHQP